MPWAPPERQARHFLVALGLFWLLWGVMVTGFLADAAFLVGVGVMALPACFYALALGYAIEAGDASGVRLSDVANPRRGRGFGSQMAAPFNMMRPSFFRDVAVASGWNVPVVLGVLALLLVTDLVLFGFVMATMPEEG